MAYYSNFHHSNHPNFKQPYSNNRPNRRMMDTRGHYSAGPPINNGYNGYQNGYHNPGPNGGAGGGGGGGGNTLWMGNIDSTMDENVIKAAFDTLGINVNNIKIIRNQETGLPLGYGFVSFDDRNTAQDVLRELNGKRMPNFDDDKRFFLKRANRNAQRYSIFVGNLTPDIDDEILLSAFNSYYPSASSAKVIMSDGQSKGFGFVSFENEMDYRNALNMPNMMLGTNPISVNKARHSGGGGGNNQRFNNSQYQDNNRFRRQPQY